MNSSIPKFLNTLYHILLTEDQRIIRWTSKGDAFEIRNVSLLEGRILPKYFKHKKLSSFQRQLNYFGFRKWTKTQTSVCTFSHPYFRRFNPEALVLITKKPTSSSVLPATKTSRKRSASQVDIPKAKHSRPNTFQTEQIISIDDLVGIFDRDNSSFGMEVHEFLGTPPTPSEQLLPDTSSLLLCC